MTDDSEKQASKDVPIRYKFSEQFLPVLSELGCSLLVSTYQASQLVSIGCHEGSLAVAMHKFDNVMGVAPSEDCLAVGARGMIWQMRPEHNRAASIPPAGAYDKCFLTRKSHVTGHIHVHEMIWVEGQLLVVNTLFSCLCTLDDNFSFVPVWKPNFITALKGEDRCHINGIAKDRGRARFVSMMAQSDTAGGWRENKNTTGLVMEIGSQTVVTQGLSMPHSPRVFNDALWVLNSGYGSLDRVDLGTGKREQIVTLPGYARGLSFHGNFAFIGLSKIRETAVFGGVPLAEYHDELRCGVVCVDLTKGESVAYFEFEDHVTEIFDVQVLSNTRNPHLVGPNFQLDSSAPVWVIPNDLSDPKA